MRPRHNFLQIRPIKTWAGVFFTAWCDVLMARNVRDGVLLAKCQTKLRQAFVLSSFKVVALKAFQFNANGVVVAIAATSITGGAGVPGPLLATYKLPNLARSFNEKMGGNF